MDGFWTALKRELDERDLCYPRTLWWDQEDWAVPTQAVRNLPDDLPRGTFTLQLGDARAGAEQLMDSVTHGTLNEIWNATKPSTPASGYDDAESVTEDVNQPFLNWYLGWSIAIGQQAMWRAMMEKAKELFPLAVWSNYDRFSADNPGFKYVGGTPRLGYYNTPPASQATFHGDYSSPKLYTAVNLHGMVNDSDRLAPEMGVTHPQVMRNTQKSRIDACTNAFTARPVAPHFETGIKRWTISSTYDLTQEDVFDIMAYAWKRGVTHFLPFVFEGDAGEDGPAEYESDASDDDKKLAQDRMYEVCFRVLNTVHWLPQENHARVARVSRRGW